MNFDKECAMCAKEFEDGVARYALPPLSVTLNGLIPDDDLSLKVSTVHPLMHKNCLDGYKCMSENAAEVFRKYLIKLHKEFWKKQGFEGFA